MLLPQPLPPTTARLSPSGTASEPRIPDRRAGFFGALVFRTIGDLLFVFDLDPLWQPLFQGCILLLAVSLGSLRIFPIRNRLDLFR